jgi:hypothetical protein
MQGIAAEAAINHPTPFPDEAPPVYDLHPHHYRLIVVLNLKEKQTWVSPPGRYTQA